MVHIPKCGHTERCPTGNELARAQNIENMAPLVAHILKQGQIYRCTLPAGHDGHHREDWGRGFGVNFGPGSYDPEAKWKAMIAGMKPNGKVK